MTELKLSGSISVAVAPDVLYALVSDVTRMGDWSPVCRACWWDEGAGPEVGAWFTGRNEIPERTYTFESEDGGTRLTESWEFLPSGIAGFRERFGAEAAAQIAIRRAAAEAGIPATLAAIKKTAEAG